MTFISYAQNFEDIVLHRALADVKNGFYIDVGAQHPVEDSVTKAFYDEGWRGINIEPVTEWFEKLAEDRKEDVNLQVAVGAREGEVDFYEVTGTGLSTMIEANAVMHLENSAYKVIKRKVPVRTLRGICREYACEEVHFLKIDVEGAERLVLEGLDFKELKPWIVVVEATVPTTTDDRFEEWEPLLTDAGYAFAYFDGLNRFYVSNEHRELLEKLSVPPNVFDEIVMSGTATSMWHCQVRELKSDLAEAAAAHRLREEELAQEANEQRQALQEKELLCQGLQTQLEHVTATREEAEQELERKRIELQSLQSLMEQERASAEIEIQELAKAKVQLMRESELREEEVQAIHASMSWRLTLPMRKAYDLVRWPIRQVKLGSVRVASYVKRGASWAIRKAIALVLGNPKLLRRATVWYNRYPRLGARLSILAQQSNGSSSIVSDDSVVKTEAMGQAAKSGKRGSDFAHLTPRARRLYELMTSEWGKRKTEDR